MRKPSPHTLYERTGGGDAYRIAMLEHGYTTPAAPWERKAEPGSGRMLQCGNLHDFNWSGWQHYTLYEGRREFEGRWCRTCGTTQAREVEKNSTPRPVVDLSKPKVEPGKPEVTL